VAAFGLAVVAAVAGFGSALLCPLTGRIVLFGATLAPASLADAWVGKAIVGRLNDRVFTVLVEAGLHVAGVLYLAGR
jgi:hypothetical protein